MKRLCEIMEDIRGMPVCPKTGEENLYCVIHKHIGDGILQGNKISNNIFNRSEHRRSKRFDGTHQ